jgi:hypothetical protein
MLTLKLWHALHNPPSTHPIFRRTVVLPTGIYKKRRYLSWANLIIVLVLGLGEHIPSLLLFLMPILLFITGIIYGLDCALRVSHAIVREHENDTFQLLSLSPPGPLGTSWTVCTSSLYRNREFAQLHTIVKSSLLVAVVITSVLGGLVLIGQSAAFSRLTQPILPTIVVLANLAAIFGAVYAEYVQSTVLGCLVGMLIPTYVENSLDGGLYSLSGFLLAQMTVYFLTALVGFYILPSAYQLIGFYGELAEISLTALRVFTFILVREAVVRLIWRHLVERLNVQPSEFDYVLQPV